MFLWLVWGVFMVELGLIYMMLLQDHLQYEKQKKGKSIEAEKQVSREAEKHVSKEAGKSRKQRS